jgi:hypothetical protein
MKLTLELDNGWRQSIQVTGLIPDIKDLEAMCVLLDDWHKEMIKEAGLGTNRD